MERSVTVIPQCDWQGRRLAGESPAFTKLEQEKDCVGFNIEYVLGEEPCTARTLRSVGIERA